MSVNKEKIQETIRSKIYLVRGQKIMLDSDLAILYEVETRIVTRAVKRNIDRFPEDFVFQLNNQEVTALRSQTGISKTSRGGRRYMPYAFTEQGVAMLSSVLKSKKAALVNVQIMRTFVHLRSILLEHQDLKLQLEYLEQKYDSQFKSVFDAIRKIMDSQTPARKRQIGFGREEEV